MTNRRKYTVNFNKQLRKKCNEESKREKNESSGSVNTHFTWTRCSTILADYLWWELHSSAIHCREMHMLSPLDRCDHIQRLRNCASDAQATASRANKIAAEKVYARPMCDDDIAAYVNFHRKTTKATDRAWTARVVNPRNYTWNCECVYAE